MTDSNVTDLVAEINSHLRLNQQIHPDDPIMASIVLHDRILNARFEAATKRLDDTIHQLTTVADQHIEKTAARAEARAEAIAERLIVKSGNNIEQQLDAAARRWEERLKKSGVETEASNRRASWLAWTGGVSIVLVACFWVGSYLGNVVYECYSPHKVMERKQSLPKHRR